MVKVRFLVDFNDDKPPASAVKDNDSFASIANSVLASNQSDDEDNLSLTESKVVPRDQKDSFITKLFRKGSQKKYLAAVHEDKSQATKYTHETHSTASCLEGDEEEDHAIIRIIDSSCLACNVEMGSDYLCFAVSTQKDNKSLPTEWIDDATTVNTDNDASVTLASNNRSVLYTGDTVTTAFDDDTFFESHNNDANITVNTEMEDDLTVTSKNSDIRYTGLQVAFRTKPKSDVPEDTASPTSTANEDDTNSLTPSDNVDATSSAIFKKEETREAEDVTINSGSSHEEAWQYSLAQLDAPDNDRDNDEANNEYGSRPSTSSVASAAVVVDDDDDDDGSNVFPSWNSVANEAKDMLGVAGGGDPPGYHHYPQDATITTHSDVDTDIRTFKSYDGTERSEILERKGGVFNVFSNFGTVRQQRDKAPPMPVCNEAEELKDAVLAVPSPATITSPRIIVPITPAKIDEEKEKELERKAELEHINKQDEERGVAKALEEEQNHKLEEEKVAAQAAALERKCKEEEEEEEEEEKAKAAAMEEQEEAAKLAEEKAPAKAAEERERKEAEARAAEKEALKAAKEQRKEQAKKLKQEKKEKKEERRAAALAEAESKRVKAEAQKAAKERRKEEERLRKAEIKRSLAEMKAKEIEKRQAAALAEAEAKRVEASILKAAKEERLAAVIAEAEAKRIEAEALKAAKEERRAAALSEAEAVRIEAETLKAPALAEAEAEAKRIEVGALKAAKEQRAEQQRKQKQPSTEKARRAKIPKENEEYDHGVVVVTDEEGVEIVTEVWQAKSLEAAEESYQGVGFAHDKEGKADEEGEAKTLDREAATGATSKPIGDDFIQSNNEEHSTEDIIKKCDIFPIDNLAVVEEENIEEVVTTPITATTKTNEETTNERSRQATNAGTVALAASGGMYNISIESLARSWNILRNVSDSASDSDSDSEVGSVEEKENEEKGNEQEEPWEEQTASELSSQAMNNHEACIGLCNTSIESLAKSIKNPSVMLNEQEEAPTKEEPNKETPIESQEAKRRSSLVVKSRGIKRTSGKVAKPGQAIVASANVNVKAPGVAARLKKKKKVDDERKATSRSRAVANARLKRIGNMKCRQDQEDSDQGRIGANQREELVPVNKTVRTDPKPFVLGQDVAERTYKVKSGLKKTRPRKSKGKV